MVIAEVAGDGRIEVLERLQRAVRLGQDTFRRGRLGGESMRIGPARVARLSEIARSLQSREDPRRGHQRRPRGKQRRHVSRPRLHGHAIANRRDRHLRGKPADGLRRSQGRGTRLGRRSESNLDRRRGRGQHALVDPPGRRDCHLAKPATGLHPPARDVLHQRGIAASLGRPAAAAHLQCPDQRCKTRCP